MNKETVLGVEAYSCDICDIGPFVTGEQFGYQSYGEDRTIDMFPANTKLEAMTLGRELAAKLGCEFQDLDC